ncbi:hypothetical protein [Hyphomonas sp.]|jgi:hypothetical protein|uniref:hypothetical protein n=1 Tax=Hyphomonas sp. TaxID=87 RepID=UPI0032EC6012
MAGVRTGVEITDAQRDALDWLRKHNGDGVFMRGNIVMAAGEVAPFQWKTWKALIENGRCEAYQMGKGRRIRVVVS